MAEALDTFSDLDLSDSDSENESALNKQFDEAAGHVKNLLHKLDSVKLLEIYGLYKQGTEGPCNIERPKWYEMQAKQKWDAWNALGDMSSDSAKEKYISLIKELDQSFGDGADKNKPKTNKQWAAVSSLNTKVKDVAASQKTIYDFCKEGNTSKVKILIIETPGIVNELDSDGLGLIHWAADRGYYDMLKLLLEHNCYVSLKDNFHQTALHYAASCGHADCIVLLLKHGADKSSVDEDGCTPLDVADEDDIKQLLL